MKIMYISLLFAIYSFAGWTTRGEVEEYSQSISDSITLIGKKNADKLKRLYEKEKNTLLADLDSVRHVRVDTIVKVVQAKPAGIKTKTIIKYVPRYDTVIIKYSLYSTRGAHVKTDTVIKKGKSTK